MDALAFGVLKPMSEWQQTIQNMSVDERRELADAAGDLAVRLARLSSYANAWYLNVGHTKALQEQNRVARELRSALGFTYPQENISF